MWNDKRSLALSKLSVLLFMGVLVGVAVAAPWLVDQLQTHTVNAAAAEKWCYLVTIYTGAVPAALLLYDLYRLLHALDEGSVFIAANEHRLRRISWYCLLGGIIAAASGLYYLPWLFIGIAALFVALIVRVVKNVVQQAILLKTENDYTI